MQDVKVAAFKIFVINTLCSSWSFLGGGSFRSIDNWLDLGPVNFSPVIFYIAMNPFSTEIEKLLCWSFDTMF